MELQEIEEKLSRRATLTEAEKAEVVKAIYENPEANAIAFKGAVANGNYELAAPLAVHHVFKDQFKKKAA